MVLSVQNSADPSIMCIIQVQQASTDGIDGVVFYLPPEDCVVGWDYPRRRRFLDERKIPQLLFCGFKRCPRYMEKEPFIFIEIFD